MIARQLQVLERLRGVGRWTAEYALLRGFGRLHIFPGDDVGARNNLARWLDCRGSLDYAGVRAAVDHWRPYAGLVYLHLLLASLAEQGTLVDRPVASPESDSNPPLPPLSLRGACRLGSFDGKDLELKPAARRVDLGDLAATKTKDRLPER